MISLSKRMIRCAAIVFAIAAVTACTTTQVSVAPASLSDAETAVLQVNPTNPAASIIAIYDSEGQMVRRANYWTENLREVTIRPGYYEVVLRVDGTTPELTEYPRVKVNVEPGGKYEVAQAPVKQDWTDFI